MKKSIFIIAILKIIQINAPATFMHPPNLNPQQIRPQYYHNPNLDAQDYKKLNQQRFGGQYPQNLQQQIRPQYYQDLNDQQINTFQYPQQQIRPQYYQDLNDQQINTFQYPQNPQQQIRPQYYQNLNDQQLGIQYQPQINRGLNSQIASEENKRQLENQKRITKLKYELHLKMSETQKNLIQVTQLIEECRRINSNQSKQEKKYHKVKQESLINSLTQFKNEEKLIAEIQKTAIEKLNFSHVYKIGLIQIKSNQKLAKEDITLVQPFLSNKHNLHLLVTPSENNIQKIEGQTTMNARQLKVVNSNTTNPEFMITQKELDALSEKITHCAENEKQILQEKIKKRENQLNKLGNFTYEYTVSTNAAQINSIKSNRELTQQDILNINYFISKYPGVKMEIAMRMPTLIQKIFK